MENKPAPLRPDWKQRVVRHWKPHSLARPTVNRKVGNLSALQRAASVLRYSLFRFEYWLSPGGTMREWVRFNVALALMIGIPAVVVVPIVTFLLWQFATWTEYLIQIAINLLLFPLLLLGAVAVITAFLCLLRGLLKK